MRMGKTAMKTVFSTHRDVALMKSHHLVFKLVKSTTKLHQAANLIQEVYWREEQNGQQRAQWRVGFYWGLSSMPSKLVEKYSTAGSIVWCQL